MTSMRTDGRPHFWPFVTPEHKREMAAILRRTPGIGGDPDFWDALAALQEQDRIDEWLSTCKAWEDAKPHPRDLLKETTA